MAEYIEREACLSILRAKANMAVLMDAAPYFEKAAQMLEKLPAADVAPVVHGRWICEWDAELGTTKVICSRCKYDRTVGGCYVGTNGESLWDADDYCPNCGAKMDGVE